MIGIGFAPVSFVLFWFRLELASFTSPLYLIYLVEAVIYMALFWFLAGQVTAMPPLSRRLITVAMVAGSIPLWLTPIHCRIVQGIGGQKPLATLFADEYKHFHDLRTMQRTEDMTIHRPPPSTVHTRTVARKIESKPKVNQRVVQQRAVK